MNFKTKDFYIGSILLCFDLKILKLHKQSKNFVEFEFDSLPEDCHQIIASYWANELTVNPKKLIDSINELKTRLYMGV